MRLRLLPLGLALAVLSSACAPSQPQLGMHYDVPSHHISPSVSTSFGGISLAASGSGGAIGTRLGPIGLSAGF